MAKYCGNCGAQMPDDALVCGVCGTPFDMGPAPSTAHPGQGGGPVGGGHGGGGHAMGRVGLDGRGAGMGNGMGPGVGAGFRPAAQRKLPVLWIAIGGGVLALILIIVAAVLIIPNFTGYRALLRRTMTAFEDYDIDAMLDDGTEVYYGDTAEYIYSSTVSGVLDDLEDQVGHNYKFSYQVNEYYEMSSRQQERLEDSLSVYVLDKDDFDIWEQVVVADVTVTGRKDSNEDEIDIMVLMSKEENGWKLIGFQRDY